MEHSRIEDDEACIVSPLVDKQAIKFGRIILRELPNPNTNGWFSIRSPNSNLPSRGHGTLVWPEEEKGRDACQGQNDYSS